MKTAANWVVVLGAVFFLQRAGAAPVIWTGPNTTFTKSASTPEDPLTDNVWITRGATQGIYNSQQESGFTHNLSPKGTEWAYGSLDEWNSLTYLDWETWTASNPPSTVGRNAVVHLIQDGIYLQLKFLNWGGSISGGAFSYERSTPPVGPPTLVWNGGAIGNDAWTAAANWGGTAPVAGAVLHFGAPASGGHASNSNDFPLGTSFGGITFLGDAPTYNLMGHAINLGGAVANQSAQDQTITLDMELTSADTTFDTGAKQIEVVGSLSGAEKALSKLGAGTLVLSGTNNTYGGGTTITAGVLEVATPQALPPGGSVSIGSSGTLTLRAGLGGAAVGASAVPEPSGFALAGVLIAAMVAFRSAKAARLSESER